VISGASAGLAGRVLGQPDALVCALSLDPAVLSRNRHFALYTSPAMRRAHGRARALRLLARDLRQVEPRELTRLELREAPGCAVHLVYRDSAASLTRRVVLEAFEVSLLKLLVAARGHSPPHRLSATDADRDEIRARLGRIGLQLDEPAAGHA
jgi:hypothetical protein